MKVGFIGLGRMGSGMASSVLRAGYDVTVYNRTPGRSGALAAQGASVAATAAQACRAEAVITMLANDAAVEKLVLGPDGVVNHLPRGAPAARARTADILRLREAGGGESGEAQRQFPHCVGDRVSG